MTNYFKNIIIILAVSFLFIACNTKEAVQPTIIEAKQDEILQLSNLVDDNIFNQELNTNEFFIKFFKPWKQTKLSYPKNEAMWGLSYKNKKVYLENHNLATKEWFDKHIENTNFEQYNQEVKKAITLKNTNVRVIPTNSPMFYNPQLPGEGFPFDYNQNSLLKINTPIIVSHLSKDQAWAYIESHFVGGWVEINNIAFVDENFMQEFEKANFFISVKEKFPIYDNIFREYIKVGTIFPKKDNLFIIAKADDKQNAVISHISLDENQVEQMPLKYTSENRTKILKEFLNEPYGWGGLLNNRDCSSFTQDYFSVFGKYLHRNSKAQTINGKYLDISNLTLEEKKEFIKQNGIPFSTLVYLKGHIMLYIGIKNNEPLVVHNIWSVRMKDKDNKEFRHIIGKAIITTLEPAKEIEGFIEDSNILKRVLGITIL
ncbi:SH3 domain-containing protein [Arcobacter lanthieri]|uniref:C40 family peptidase n=1 Tax=Aliarcobacter lanthieri TaxID=1355374 RepID=UPI001920A826|nr:SH3 domain-containing C40 family peptidase [Aliarcobacter lanthieri]MBL3518934.1 SH3 domain-containing protein [Aliarcobacter lanthieri]